MELRHLRYFIAVAEEENVTRAAARLNVSQPPLSRQIRDLEEEIGVELFERHGKSVKLTEAGRVFLKQSRTVLSCAANAVKTAQAAVGDGKRELQVGYSPSLAVELLPQMLRVFGKKAPAVRVNLYGMMALDMIAAVREGRLDAAFVTRHPADRIRGVTFEPLRLFRVGVMVSKGHRFARKPSIAAADVLAEPLAVFSRQQYALYHKWLRSLFGARVKSIRFIEECDSGLSLIAAVESARGVAVCCEGQITFAGSRVVFIPLVPAPQPVEIGICYTRRGLASASTRQFIETARSLRPKSRDFEFGLCLALEKDSRDK